MHQRKRILFFAESVTLSQVVRLVSLARALDPREYELHFASAEFDPLVFMGTSVEAHRVFSVSAAEIAARLRFGRRLYGTSVLRRYVAADQDVLARVRPHLVVGDFRLSLAVSAPTAGVPYAALANAYFSPHAVRDGFPMPEHPIVRLLGERLAARHFPKALPFVFEHFARPVNELRQAYGLPPVGSLLCVLTYGDYTLYADSPGLVPTEGAPSSHEYLGPIFWAPDVPAPAIHAARSTHPSIYVTLGSSGSEAALPVVLDALGTLPVTALVSTAGRPLPARTPPNVSVARFVAGDAAARQSSLVICNGGSSTGYQALAEGVPVLGIASNLDQYLAMTHIEKAGAGKLLRSGTLTREAVRDAVTSLLDSPDHAERARAVARQFSDYPYAPRFRRFVRRVLSSAVVRPTAAAAVLSALVLSRGRPASAEPAAPVTNEIRFGVAVASPEGHVLCALFRRAGWLSKPVQWKKVAIRRGQVDCVFTGIEPGVYGLSAIHDENDNGKLDTNFLGIPTESWCTSRDAPAFFGPPSFDDAKFQYRGNVMRLRAALK